MPPWPRICAVGLALVAAASQPAFAAGGLDAHVQAGASIVAFDGVDSSEMMTIATLATGDAGGTFTLGLDGTVRTADGGATADMSGKRASIAINAVPDRAYGISFPSSLTIAGQTILVSEFQTDPPLAGGLLVGQHDLAVGATIAIPAHMPPGLYVGSFDLTVQNN